jgi:tyrosine-specific transport protein
MKHLLILEGSSVIIGTVVGAGVLGLPFAFVKAGFLTGLTLLIIISFCLTLLSLFLGEVALRTKGNHQLTGYTELYLGATFKHIQAILMLFGMYGALLAYTIGFGQILSSLFGASAIVWSIGVYALLSYLVVRGLGIIKKAEFIIAILIIGLIFTLAIITTPHLSYTHLTGFDWFSFLIPYGAILFACSGLAAIPEAKEILETKKGTKFLRSVIILGHLVPTVIYIIFTFVVVGVTG